jgi:hypothetical protein|tara:strand:+ start:3914 stop:4162 length:249 start_codon:yes stop_codon:yes gene_type:complete
MKKEHVVGCVALVLGGVLLGSLVKGSWHGKMRPGGARYDRSPSVERMRKASGHQALLMSECVSCQAKTAKTKQAKKEKKKEE